MRVVANKVLLQHLFNLKNELIQNLENKELPSLRPRLPLYLYSLSLNLDNLTFIFFSKLKKN